jgi:malic enzyme
VSRPQAKEVTDKMFASAAQRLADYVPKESFDEGKIYPDLPDLRDISLKARMMCDPIFQP